MLDVKKLNHLLRFTDMQVKKHARTCNQCFKGMNEGYLIDGGNTVCSEKCARSFIGSDNFDVEMSIWELEGDNNYIFWTDWNE